MKAIACVVMQMCDPYWIELNWSDSISRRWLLVRIGRRHLISAKLTYINVWCVRWVCILNGANQSRIDVYFRNEKAVTSGCDCGSLWFSFLWSCLPIEQLAASFLRKNTAGLSASFGRYIYICVWCVFKRFASFRNECNLLFRARRICKLVWKVNFHSKFCSLFINKNKITNQGPMKPIAKYTIWLLDLC